uniref:ribosomal protein L16 n=1 Tax=Centroceras gasparrinii TaxID=371099 RepID=UPI002E7A125E|nr:ribosomal protein L16 [Centroceras gasparrinii]WQF69483.1 ribosomal protein L16 [Centroceras gasparrinii]
MIRIKKHKNFSLIRNQKSHILQFGQFGLKNLNPLLVKEKQLSTFFWILNQCLRKLALKNNVKIWKTINLNLTLTKLSLESRMGKGKGNFYSTAIFLKPGKILCEIDNIEYSNLKKISKFLNKKFSGKLIIVSRF